MTARFHPAPELRLARMLARDGGMTAAEAVQRADALAAQNAPMFLKGVDAALQDLERHAADLSGDASPEQLRAIYAAADELVGLAGAAKLPELSRAAYSLCDLVERFRQGAPVKRAALRVHLDAMALFRRPAAETGAQVDAVMEGLSLVVRSA